MFYFRQGSKMFFSHIFLSMVLALQIAVSIFLVGITASKINYINSGVSLFNEISDVSGLYVMPATELDASDFDVSDYSKQIDGVKNISKIYSNFYFLNDAEAEFIYYDDFIIENCRLPLKYGAWFDEFDSAGAVPVVISNEQGAFKLGAEFEIDGQKYTVIGVLADARQYITFDYGGNAIDITYLVENYDDVSPLFICPQSYFSEEFLSNIIESTNFLVTFDEISYEKKANATQQFNDMGYTKSISELYEDGQKNVKAQLINLSPYIIISFLLSLIGVASSVTLMMFKEIRKFSVFYICGIPWKNIKRILPVYTCFLFLFAVAFYFAIYVFCISAEILSYYEVLLSFKEMLMLAAVLIIIFIVSAVPINIIFKKIQPVDILYQHAD